MKTAPLFLIPILIVFLSSCEKKKTIAETPPTITTNLASGLLENPSSINGYVYASQTNNSSSSNYSYYYAVFGDPARNLMINYNHFNDQIGNSGFNNADRGNVQVGSNITIAGYNITAQVIQSSGSFGEVHYFNFISNSFNTNASIRTDGNGSFKPLNFTISRGYPKILTSSSTQFTANVKQNYNLDISNLISNFDSLIVRISSNGSPYINVMKNVVAGAKTITFSSQELSGVSQGSYLNLYFQAFNYSNITIEDKRYIFELANKATYYVQFY
jgi:hypothetical protein